jgi:hypothetical protein
VFDLKIVNPTVTDLGLRVLGPDLGLRVFDRGHPRQSNKKESRIFHLPFAADSDWTIS